MSGRRLRWGRSRQSMLLLTTTNAHVFAWHPRLGARSTGLTVRWRDGDDWTHWRVILLERGKRHTHHTRAQGPNGAQFLARRTLTLLEISHWRTTGGTQQRTTLKSYVRVKASPGGRLAAMNGHVLDPCRLESTDASEPGGMTDTEHVSLDGPMVSAARGIGKRAGTGVSRPPRRVSTTRVATSAAEPFMRWQAH